MSDRLVFRAPEYQVDGGFKEHQFCFEGSSNEGWTVFREGESILQLGAGYVPVQTLACGICATDLARRHLPFPLPQITGHEVVGLFQGDRVVVDINASHRTRGIAEHDCRFCRSGFQTHCPERKTLGIHALPGGFGPWFLAPTAGLYKLPKELGTESASFVEPLAAAIRAVSLSPPRPHESVAVLGPRRLGMLIVAALAAYRLESGIPFRITALSRHEHLGAHALALGADTSEFADTNQVEAFDLVFDTTGHPTGLATALRLARREVHLKSTHGLHVMGLNRLTDLVVDELAIEAYSPSFVFPEKVTHIWVSPDLPRRVSDLLENAGHQVYRLPIQEACSVLESSAHSSAPTFLSRFDAAIVSSLAEIDSVIRPRDASGIGLLRPLGTLLLAFPEPGANFLTHALARGVRLSSSRCGSSERALDLLKNHPGVSTNLAHRMITHRFLNNHLSEAFMVAADSSQSIKVLVTHPASP